MKISFTKKVREEISHHIGKFKTVEESRLTFDRLEIKKDLRLKFIRCGMIYDPKRGYHLEYRFKTIDEANITQKELATLDIEGKMSLSEERKVALIYIVDSKTIMEVLKQLGALKSLKEYTKVINEKRKIGNTNRIVNFETANIKKSANATLKQLEDIKKLQKKYDINTLDNDIRLVIKARTKYKTLGLTELADKLKITKSALNHRFIKIRKLIGE